MLGSKDKCFICGKPHVDRHHIFGGRNRQMSEAQDCVVYLCRDHHREAHDHPNTGLDLYLKRTMQKQFEMTSSREQFLKLFEKSYMAVNN